jgi:Domain of unknown function (DUF1833)
MSLTQAIQEAYADPEVDDDIIDTLELNHPSFETPVRIVANADSDMNLPLEGGRGIVLFQALPVSLVLQGFDDDGPTSGQLSIDNVSKKLQPYLKEAVKAGHPMQVVYRGYTTADLTQPGEVRGGMLLSRVSLGPTSATGTLEPASKADRQAFPRVTYSLAKYKALHGL